MSDSDCTPGREPRSVAASLHVTKTFCCLENGLLMSSPHFVSNNLTVTFHDNKVAAPRIELLLCFSFS